MQENEFPQLPDDWHVIRLRFMTRESKERNGATPVGQMLSVSEYRGVVPRVYDYEEQKRTDEELTTYRVVRPGQLAVNTMWLNHLGLGVSDHLGHVSPAYAVYDISDEIEIRYAHHLLRSQFYLKIYLRYLYGIRPNSFQIKSDDWNSIPIIVPPRDTQKTIADFLDHETARIDQLIEKKEQMVALLSEKRRSVVDRAVNGDGTEEGRGVKLKQACTLYGDYGLNISAESYIDHGVPLIRTSDFDDNGNLDLSESKCVTYNDARDKLLKRGDVLFSRAGTIGKSTVFDDDIEATFAAYLVRFRPRQSVLATRFLHFWAQSEHFWRQVRMDTIESTIGNFNAAKLGNLSLPKVSLDTQKAIANFLDGETAKLSQASMAIEKSIKRLREYRAALITTVVTGQLEVPHG